ncbi:sickle tail protein homolog [Aulostomus maculatus]
MSDGEMLSLTVPFNRGCKTRASLPVGRSSGQTREKSLGVLFLQYGDETKQIRMPAEISSQDTLRALFVTAFPQQLTMKMLQSPNMAIYIKDTNRNVYYDLEDIRNITSHSFLKVYHKDPSHVFNRHSRPANTDGRITKEVLYGSHSPVHTLSSSSRGTVHSLQGSMSPPMVRSMPSSPSRMVYGGGRSTVGGLGVVDAGSNTLRLAGAGRSSTLCTSSSAILERRDVKPDEDVGSSKSMALVVRGEGGSHYTDSYCSSLHDGGGGRLSIGSSQCSAPPSLTADMVDAGVPGIPGGLQQYRASVKPLMGYGDSVEHQTRSLHRQKSRKYGESTLPPLGTKTPPPSPHRVNEVKMIEGQIIGGVGLVSPERMSPIRRSLRRESNGATVEIVNRSRGSGSSSSTSSVFVDSPLGPPERPFQGHVIGTDIQSERMKAMEEQIASLAGLVHHALSIGPDIPRVKGHVSDNEGRSRLGEPSEPQDAIALIDNTSSAPLALLAPPGGLQHSLALAKRNVSELRLQLNHLRRLQLSNQETVSSMLRMAGQELVVLMYDRLAQSEEAVHRRRTQMEEERIHYLATEERILNQLSELEDYVNHLQTNSASIPGQLSVTLKDVEEGAVNLRRVGEALAILKGEFPELQGKMRSVLRLEVEAVRFLKEEPHKMDSMLKRVKALTEALSSLRRCVSESTPPVRSAQLESVDPEPLMTRSPQGSPKPTPRASVRSHLPTPSSSLTQSEVSPTGSASPVMPRRMKTPASGVTQTPHHHPSPPLTPTHGRDSPTVAKVSPCSREGSPALQKKPSPLDGLSNSCEASSCAPASTQESQADKTASEVTHTHTESTERETPEGSLSLDPSGMNQPSNSKTNQPTSSTADFDKVPQDTQATLIKSIPDLEVSDTRVAQSDLASGQTNLSASKSELETPLDLTLQAPQPVTQEHKPLEKSDEVDSSTFKPTAAAAASQPPAATTELPPSAPPSASPGTKRSGRLQVEKPRRSSVDKEMKQSPDRVGKSPPPPPRRFHAPSSGLTTGRTGEVIFTTRKEPLGAQDASEKEPPVAPQPKPPRQPPEVKPKPQICRRAPPATSTSTPAAASARTKEEEEEEEEDNKFMKELQVTADPSNNKCLPGGSNQFKGQENTSSTSQVLVTSGSAPQTGTTDDKHLMAVGLERGGASGGICAGPDQREEAGEKKIKQEPPKKKNAPNDSMVLQRPKKMELPLNSVEENDKNSVTHEQNTQEEVSSPTTPGKKVTFTTIVTLQREDNQSADQTNEKTVQQGSAEEKSNMMVLLTLEKENTQDERPKESSLESQRDKPKTSILDLNPSRKIHIPTVQVPSDQEYFPEGGSLSPDVCDDEGPPPPPLPRIGRIAFHNSKTRGKTQSKDGNPNGSVTQTVAGNSADQPTYHVNQAFEDNDDSKPIIIILNEPLDIQSHYKRLSTIFECEEDIDGLLSSECIIEEEEIKDEEMGQSETNKGLDLKEIAGNGLNSLHKQLHKAQEDNSIPNKQDQIKPDTPRKMETKQKFKFKFPKNKLAALSQAIRSGTTKTGKKTLNVVVYEEEEETARGGRRVDECKKQTKESKIKSTKQADMDKGKHSKSPRQAEELCRSRVDSIDHLQESLKQLEISVDSINTPSSPSSIASSPPVSPDSSFDSNDRGQVKGKRERERSPSKRSASHILKGPNPPQSKRAKPQPLPIPVKPSNKKQRSHTKSRPSSPPSGSPEKLSLGQQQATQNQPSQPCLVTIPR